MPIPVARPSRLSLLVALVTAMAAVSAAGCYENEQRIRELGGFHVALDDAPPQETGTPELPLVFPQVYRSANGACPASFIDAGGRQRPLCREVVLDIQARRPDGTVKLDFNGTVELRIVPGEIHPDDRYVRLVDGRAENHTVRMRYTFGRTRIWVEDTGLEVDWTYNDTLQREIPTVIDQCTDGIDNDGNGLIDFPMDPGCDTGDVSEGGGTFTTGVSPALYFDLPTIRSVQRNLDSSTGPSPLSGQYIEATGRPGHDLVVSNVTGDGFFATDVSEQGYNSIFVFNFSFPEDVEIGDRLCELGGGVTEFNAMTQLQFPSWAIQGKPRSNSEQRLPNPEDEEDQLLDEDIEIIDCSWRYGLAEGELSKKVPVPDPVVVDGSLLADLSAMESLEGSLVSVRNIQLSTLFINCDDNGSGRIEGGTSEAICRTECNDNPFCTELSSLFGFDQWRGRVDGAEVSVASSKVAAGFDVLAACERSRNAAGREIYECPSRTLKRVTGSLRQIVPTCDRFLPCDPAEEGIVLLVLEPRFNADIVE